MIKGISEKPDGPVQAPKATGAPKNGPSPQPPNEIAAAQRGDAAGGNERAAPQGAADPRSQPMKELVDKLNKELQTLNPRVGISVDQEANRYVLRYTDPKSGEVIQQMPPEGVIETARQLKADKGLMFDSKG
ncbi:MAG: flagellar protein FlaG [Nitrospinae bacterium]|nr:flagellar protein FlaG [Nitrospinota bacterium]